MVLLLPFNLNKIETDSVKTKTEHLKQINFKSNVRFYVGANGN